MLWHARRRMRGLTIGIKGVNNEIFIIEYFLFGYSPQLQAKWPYLYEEKVKNIAQKIIKEFKTKNKKES